jgi:hypothetical protein
MPPDRSNDILTNATRTSSLNASQNLPNLREVDGQMGTGTYSPGQNW